MATDATGTPSTLGIPKYNTSSDAPSGKGLNAIVDAIDTLVAARIAKSTLSITGDILYASGANTPARLAIGSTGQILTVAGGIPSWGPTIGSSYAAYTPTWTSTGSAPSFGDATVVARYFQIGKMVHAYGAITFGAGSTFGTGAYRFALPVTAANSNVIGTGFVFHSSTAGSGVVIASPVTTSTLGFQYGATYLGANTEVSTTSPWTWAINDQIRWSFTYEAA